MSADVERLVDLENLLTRSCPGPLGYLDVGPEQPGRPALHRSGLELHVEVLHDDAERHQIRLREPSAGGEVVVLGEVVGEALADDHHAGAAETEEHADRHPDQHEEQADVEDQIAGLAQVAAFGRHAVAVHVNPVVPLPQRGGSAVQHVMIAIGHIRSGVRGQPDEVARRLGRPGPQRPGVHADPRDDAADQRHEQQQVDRGEPWRAVDVEQAERCRRWAPASDVR